MDDHATCDSAEDVLDDIEQVIGKRVGIVIFVMVLRLDAVFFTVAQLHIIFMRHCSTLR